MTKKRKWRKNLLLIIVSFLGLSLILGIIFNQLIYRVIIGAGSVDVYYGNNERGNSIMKYALSKIENPSASSYHAISVQNTKNGNYDIAISALEKAYKINPEEAGAYYGWVLLYYYHDYEKALMILNKYDTSTPNFSDWPMGECIHYLKGLAHMQLYNYEKAVKEFDISINNTSSEHGENWVNYQVFLNKGISLFHLRKYNEAILEFKKIIKHNNKSSESYFFMGLSELKLNLRDSACQNLSQAHSLMEQGYKSSDPYVELFHEIYEQEIGQIILKDCIN